MTNKPALKYGVALYEILDAPPPTNFHWALVVTTSSDWSKDVEKLAIVNFQDEQYIPWEFRQRSFATELEMQSQTLVGLVGIVEMFTSEAFDKETVCSWAAEQPVEQDGYAKFGSRWSCAFWVLRSLEILLGICGIDQSLDIDAYLRVAGLGQRLTAMKERQPGVLHVLEYV